IFHQHEGWPYKHIRQYNANGEYVKTVFPIKGGMEESKVTGWGIIKRTDGTYVPANSSTSLPGFSNTLLGTPFSPNGVLLNFDTDNNEIWFGTYKSYLKVGSDGSLPTSNGSITSGVIGISTVKGNNFISNQPFPSGVITGSSPTATRYLIGSTFMTMLPGKTHALVSGIFYAFGANGHLTNVPDSTFYKDGQIFKVNIATGVAVPWLALSGVPELKTDRQIPMDCAGTWAAVAGTAIDAAGRIYVCERFGKRLAVYDSNATLLNSIPVAGAENVTISKKTGAIYLVTKTQLPASISTGTVKVYKISSFESGLSKICSLTITTAVSSSTEPISVIVNESTSDTRVWVAYMTTGVKIYSDNGTSLTLFRDFEALSANTLQGYARLAVDRRTETVYINNTWYGMYKIMDWNNPVPSLCSTTVPNRPASWKYLTATDMAVSPHGMLYVRQATASNGSQFSGPVTRWSTDRIHAPLEWANTDSNVLVPVVTGRYGATAGERGLSVGVDNRVAVMPGSGTWSVSMFADSGNHTAWAGDTVIKTVAPTGKGGSGCVRIDLQGNIYVGAVMNFATPLHPEFATDWAYNNARGTIVKFPPNIKGGRTDPTGATGAEKTYNIGVAPFSKDRGAGGCVCRSPRFDVDYYGRMFAPNAVTCEVTIMDNAGNEILRFGQYDNTDFPKTDSSRVPLMWATGVAASDDFVYVADNGSYRMHRVQMLYDIDNYPNTKPKHVPEEKQSLTANSVSLKSNPNPFNPTSNINITLNNSSRIRLDVFDVSGKFITTIASDIYGAGTHSFVWNATDLKGSKVSAGTYIYRLVAGNRELYTKAVLAK
ncbi:MAG: T9SS type A sorting domain-containing protein, partial [Fibrobacteres bacterium]|nr:T9SS type A sorting domain-containing protein [Fibrobacterota bacterium]